MLCTICTSIFAQSVVYKGGKGPGQGKHLVLVASDHEYRAEETIPALARFSQFTVVLIVLFCLE